MVTRRCTQRQFLLVPSGFLNAFFLFALAHAAALFGVQVHAACVLSNHYHIIVTDPRGIVPRFVHWIDGILARALNAYHGRWENFWAPSSYSLVELVDADAVLDKIVYVLTNPVEAGLVAHGAQWPGVRLSPRRIGQSKNIKRPKFFFRQQGPVPSLAALTVAKPPAFADETDEAFVRRVEAAVEAREKAIRERFAREGRKFLGRKKVLSQKVHDRPANAEPRQGLNPAVASPNKWKRIEALQVHKQFVQEYRAALAQFCRGVRDVLFPEGTYWLRLHSGVAVAALAPS
jgi:REP element-mobilizing transposase RayT